MSPIRAKSKLALRMSPVPCPVAQPPISNTSAQMTSAASDFMVLLWAPCGPAGRAPLRLLRDDQKPAGAGNGPRIFSSVTATPSRWRSLPAGPSILLPTGRAPRGQATGGEKPGPPAGEPRVGVGVKNLEGGG